MEKILKFLKKSYREIYTSIAFYPVLISVGFLILAFSLAWLERLEAFVKLKEYISEFIIKDTETAKTILSTLIGGIISLTVFSFTMVMVVLSQASSNFSPRLLPGLISNRRHQIILGVYIGTLVFCMINLISLGATSAESKHFGLAVMIASLLGVLCLGLFVSFIHSISRAIQIENIVNQIFEDSEAYLKKKIENNYDPYDSASISTKNWKVIHLDRTGYYRGFEVSLLNNSLKKKKNRIEIIPHIDQFLWQGEPIFRVENEISREEQDSLLFALRISSDRHGPTTTISGMIKLMEIAVKALSPGINDPGTAIDAVIKLGSLLHMMTRTPNTYLEEIHNCDLTLIRNNILFSKLMRVIIQPIRFYAKKDNLVLHELVRALKYVTESTDITEKDKKTIEEELSALQEDIQNYMTNKKDLERIKQALTV